MVNHKSLEVRDRSSTVKNSLSPLFPLLFVSIAVHAALLLWHDPKLSQSPSSLTYTEVEITDLVTPKALTTPTPIPQAAPNPIPKAPESLKEAVVPSPKIENTIDAPKVSPVAPTPQPTSEANITPTPSPSPTITPTPSPSPSPTLTAIASSSTVATLFDQLASGNPGLMNASPALFADPTLFFNQTTLKPNILRAIAIAEKSPIQVQVEILQTQAQKANFQVFERGTYGEGTVYEVRQDSNIWYFNLVPTKDATGTIVVVWQQDPSSPINNTFQTPS